MLIARSLVEGALLEDKYSGDLNRRTFMAFMAKKSYVGCSSGEHYQYQRRGPCKDSQPTY